MTVYLCLFCGFRHTRSDAMIHHVGYECEKNPALIKLRNMEEMLKTYFDSMDLDDLISEQAKNAEAELRRISKVGPPQN